MDQSPFARIAVGVDDSDAAIAAATYAARLARDHGGRLVLCHAVDWISLVAEAGSSGAYIDVDAIISGLRIDGKEALERGTAIARRFGVSVERRMPDGPAAEQLLSVAVETGCGSIVVGTHGRRGIGRMILGSTAELVLRGSSVPVITVRTALPPEQETLRCFSRILVGIDDSEPSDAALQTIFALPAEDRRELLIYSAVDLYSQIGAARGSAVEHERFAQSDRIVDRALGAAQAHNVKARGLVLEGRAEDVIVKSAATEGADLIVVGSHGRRGMRRFFLGSVAEHVVRTAPVPTMVVRGGTFAALQLHAPLEVAAVQPATL